MPTPGDAGRPLFSDQLRGHAYSAYLKADPQHPCSSPLRKPKRSLGRRSLTFDGQRPRLCARTTGGGALRRISPSRKRSLVSISLTFSLGSSSAILYFVGGFGVMGWFELRFEQAIPDPLARRPWVILQHMTAPLRRR